MSFQAYLDALEDQTGHTPAELLALAHERGFTAESKASEVVHWLKSDFGAGHGRAMAFFHVLKNGPQIGDKHVGSGGTHSDPSNVLLLDGKAHRARP